MYLERLLGLFRGVVCKQFGKDGLASTQHLGDIGLAEAAIFTKQNHFLKDLDRLNALRFGNGFQAVKGLPKTNTAGDACFHRFFGVRYQFEVWLRCSCAENRKERGGMG